MNSPLENLAGTGGSLVAEAPNELEITGLLRSGRVRLSDAGGSALSLESRFNLAFGED